MKHLFCQPVTIILVVFGLWGLLRQPAAHAGLNISGTIEGSWGNVNLSLRDSWCTWPRTATVIAPVPWGYATSYTWPGGSYYQYSGYLGTGVPYGGYPAYGRLSHASDIPAPPQPGMYIRQTPARELGTRAHRRVPVEPLLHSRPTERKSIAVPLPIEPLEYLGVSEPTVPTLVANPKNAVGNPPAADLPATARTAQNAWSPLQPAQGNSPGVLPRSVTTGRTRFSEPIHYFGEGNTLDDLYGRD